MNWVELLYPWQPSPTVVIATVGCAWLYLRGRRRRPVSWGAALSFWVGLLLTYAALHTRWDYYAEREFFLHRLQHLVLHHLGPFFIALAQPGPVLLAGLPETWRRRLVEPVLKSWPVRKFTDLVMQPVVAGVLFVGLIWWWLLPGVHFYAMLDVDLYRVMNWSMTVDGLFFWFLVLDRRASPPARLSPPLRIVLLAAVIPPQLLSGALVTLAPDELYPLYELCGRAFASISAHNDQVLGGLILWIPGTMMSLVGVLLAMYDWYANSRDGQLAETGARPPGVPSGQSDIMGARGLAGEASPLQ